MASLQAYTSHGKRYYRIVESYRKEGKPHLRVVAHLGKVEDILRLVEGEDKKVRVQSFMAGAVCALYGIAQELDMAGKINQVVKREQGRVRVRDGLTVGETLVAAAIARACAPGSKRAFADWAEGTHLPDLIGFEASQLTSQHFWDQMDAVAERALPRMEEAILVETVRVEGLNIEACVYDTTNFYTYISSQNERTKLAERGHNKQRRHDLRQLGLALVVDRKSQLPLFHELYRGARNDVRTLRELMRPIRSRLKKLKSRPEQLTLIFDAGSNSSENLKRLKEHFVVGLRPSDHRRWLEKIANRLQEVSLSNAECIEAYRERREVLGTKREVVAYFSRRLYEGQLRGLGQRLERVGQELEKVGTWSRYRPETLEKRLAKIVDHQYVRRLIHYELEKDARAGTRIRIWMDLEEYRRLTRAYFGFRVLATNRSDWSTAEIVEAYRSQSRVESAFRDLKDPGMISTHPQFHWTDQKLRVHAFLCVMAYLLVRLLWWRFQGQTNSSMSPRTLLAKLKKVRIARLVEASGKVGRPRLRYQLEEMDEQLRQLAELTGALPNRERFRIYGDSL